MLGAETFSQLHSSFQLFFFKRSILVRGRTHRLNRKVNEHKQKTSLSVMLPFPNYFLIGNSGVAQITWFYWNSNKLCRQPYLSRTPDPESYLKHQISECEIEL